MFKIESTNIPAKGSKGSTSDDNLSKNSEKTDPEVEEVNCQSTVISAKKTKKFTKEEKFKIALAAAKKGNNTGCGKRITIEDKTK